MSHSSVSANMSQLQTVCRLFFFLYMMIKYRDWLVIGGVTGDGRARTMMCVQALFFPRPNPVARDLRPALACKTQNNNACSAG